MEWGGENNPRLWIWSYACAMEKKTQRQIDREALKARRERLRVVADEVLDSVETLEKAITAIEATRMARLVITTDKMLVQLYSPPPQKSRGRMTIEEFEAEERAEDDDPDNEDWKDEIREIFARIDAQKAREAEDRAQEEALMAAFGPKNHTEPPPEPPQTPPDKPRDFGPRIRQL